MADIVWADENEKNLINGMLKRLETYEVSNRKKETYYLGKTNLTNMGMDIPTRFKNLGLVMGWPGTTVDVLEERLDWQGWTSDNGEDYGLGDIYADNGLDVDASMAHLDALIYGTSFAIVGAGADGEPNPLITMESARNMTGIYDTRTRRLSVALGVNERDSNGKATEVTLYLSDRNVVLGRSQSDDWFVIDENVHNLGRVLVVQFFNRNRASDQGGMSEITRTVRSLTDQAVRTMYAMEINRTFYAFPQTAIMGLNPEDFEAVNGAPTLEVAIAKILAFGKDPDDGSVPTIERLSPASPQPFIAQLQTLSQSLSAEAGMPPSYLGYQTDNPASADAIRQMESRLIKRAERRQRQFGRAWKEVGHLALLVRDGDVPEEFGTTINVKWRDAATPTRAAAADEISKLVGSGVVPADSSVTLDRAGFTPQEQRIIESDRRRGTSNQRLNDIAEALRDSPTDVPFVEPEV